jgi:hypothetical protein
MLVERKEYKEENGDIGYVESVFKSDNVLKTTYFPKSERLYIAFSRGHTYSYGNVSPELYAEFEEAESQGVFFHKKINNKTAYPARKEFTLYPNEVRELKEIVDEHDQKLEENDEEC